MDELSRLTFKLLPAAPSMGFKRERTKIAERARRNILLYENSKYKHRIKQIDIYTYIVIFLRIKQIDMYTYIVIFLKIKLDYLTLQ